MRRIWYVTMCTFIAAVSAPSFGAIATQLGISAPTSASAGKCMAVKATANAKVSAATPVTVAIKGTGVAAFTNSNCTLSASANQVTIPAGRTASSAIYILTTNAQTLTVQMIDPAGALLSSKIQSILIKPLAVAKLRYMTSPPASISAGSGFPVSTAQLDRYGNVVTTSSTTVALGLYSDNLCSIASSEPFTALPSNPVAAVSGINSFTSVSLSRPTNVYLKATYSSTISVCSSAILVTGASMPLSVSLPSAINGIEGASVSLSAATSGGTPPYSYLWTIGNQSMNGSAMLSYSFADNGTFPITLRVTDATGATAQAQMSAVIANASPTATINDPYASAINTINFSASVQDQGSADALTGFAYYWNFGDGTTSTAANPVHVYASSGTYSVSLTVTDKDGGRGTATVSVCVACNPTVSWVVPQITLVSGSNQTYDLAQTLPTCLQNNGVFSIDPSGSPLPAGMTLSASGILSVGSSAPSSTDGVLFVCTTY